MNESKNSLQENHKAKFVYSKKGLNVMPPYKEVQSNAIKWEKT